MVRTIDLRQPDLRKVEVGTVVISLRGFLFELMERTSKGKESWKDLTTGLIWHDREDEKYTHPQAVEKFGDKLPTIKEFEQAEENGFRDILPNMNCWFWSASLSSDYTNNARVFNGGNGNSDYGYFRDYVYSVRCVGR